jgi:hypothetical protein
MSEVIPRLPFMTRTGEIQLLVHLHSTYPAVCYVPELRQSSERAEEGWKEKEEK